MKFPNIETIDESIQRSLRNCSLVNRRREIGREGSSPSPPSSSGVDSPDKISGDALELNSDVSLPCHWEQCLDLKTGEIYYINWRNGSRSEEAPAVASPENGGYYSSSSYEDSSDDGDDSSSESSREQCCINKNDNVLVVAGCKSCLMYFMVPKLAGGCPKCSGQLLHFDRSDI